MRIKYVAAFMTKEASSKDPRSNQDDLKYDFEEAEEQDSQDAETYEHVEEVGGGRGRPKESSNLNDVAQAYFAGADTHNHVIYDDNVTVGYGQQMRENDKGQVEIIEDHSVFQLPLFNSIDDIYKFGSLCKLSTQRIPSETPEKPDECFAILKSI